MDLTKKQIKAIENFAIAAITFKMVMEKEARKQKGKKVPNVPKFPSGGIIVGNDLTKECLEEMVIRTKNFDFKREYCQSPKKETENHCKDASEYLAQNIKQTDKQSQLTQLRKKRLEMENLLSASKGVRNMKYKEYISQVERIAKQEIELTEIEAKIAELAV